MENLCCTSRRCGGLWKRFSHCPYKERQNRSNGKSRELHFSDFLSERSSWWSLCWSFCPSFRPFKLLMYITDSLWFTPEYCREIFRTMMMASECWFISFHVWHSVDIHSLRSGLLTPTFIKNFSKEQHDVRGTLQFLFNTACPNKQVCYNLSWRIWSKILRQSANN